MRCGGCDVVLGKSRKLCKGCREVWYCSKECATKHWTEERGHKDECKRWAAEAAAREVREAGMPGWQLNEETGLLEKEGCVRMPDTWEWVTPDEARRREAAAEVARRRAGGGGGGGAGGGGGGVGAGNARGKMKKVGANDKCPCGSGKKYKKCCRNKHV